MANKNIVIIGAGYAGVNAAKKLAKKFKKDDSVSITLIDRHSYHTMMTELHEVATHRVEPDAIQFDLRRLFNRTKVKLVTDNVTHVDHDAKKIETENGEYPYDYLILGMGAEPNDFKTPGVNEHGFTLWSFEDAIKLRSHIETTVAKAAIEHDEKKRRAMLTFVVCGSGFTGIELIGELVEWKERLAKDHKVDPDEITLYVVEAATTILNMLERREADKAEAYLNKKGVKILKDSPIVEVREHEVVLMSKKTIPTYTLAWTAGIQGNSDTENYGMEKAHARRLKVNQYMESEQYEGVYVVGDLAYFEEQPGEPTPQIVEAAEQTGATAAKNIIAEIKNEEKTAYEGKYHGIMVSIGARYGVANLMGIHLSGWFAIFVKHLVNLFYLFTIRSGYYMVKYVQHEFFQTRDKRNVFRDLLTRYGNVLWSLPLRIFVGGFWLVEGGSKLWGQEIWQKATSSIGNLPLLFKGIGQDSWLLSSTINMDFPWLQDPTSGATEAATEWAEPILSEMPGWFAWIMQIMMPTAEIALFMQKMMVFIEIGIGLAILFGLFTWLANAASVGFLTMFTLTAMLGWDKIWALPASIALMNGSGRTFGLDYWVIPYIQNKLGRFWYGTERSIYRDK
ncbi:FAD-dependent oxidoreductase [Amphibacillus indicireducens]|uniref:NADH:ubiquinone reductase (non-electrogenic) n=1 Tax=Amphibacillus indicireducens TaxID=1076330 RepID=A0ABP7VXM1_9BACI